MRSSAESLLQDLSLLLELCLVAGEHQDLDEFVERFLDRATQKICAVNGLIFVRTDLLQGEAELFPEGRTALTGETPRPTAKIRYRAFPKRRAQYMLRSTELDGRESGINEVIATGRVVISDGTQSTGHLFSFEGVDPPRFALRLPIRRLGLLELYASDDDVLDLHTGAVLSSLSDWLAGQLRAYSMQASNNNRARALEESQRSFEDLVAKLPGVVWRADKLGRFTYVSKQSEVILGLPGNSLRTHSELRFVGIHASDRARVEQSLAEAVAARKSELTLAYRFRRGAHGGGELIDIEERVGLNFDEDGRLAGQSGFISDVTASKTALRKIEELNEQRAAVARAEALRTEAERTSRTKTEFLDLLSHELRTPLFPIIALSDLLLRIEAEALKPEDLREHVKMINTAGKQMLQLVSDLLDMSRIDAGRIRPDLGPIALAHFVSSIAEKHAERARMSGVLLEAGLAASTTGNALYTDRTVLGRIASSLVEHAIEEAPKGRVQLEVDGRPRSVRVRVTIEGLALSNEECQHLFEPFWERQGERTRSKGTGLGLVLVRKLAQAFGGRALASSIGSRTIVEAELPCAYGEAREDLASGNSVRVLIGSAELATVFQAALEALSLGAEVRIAQSAGELVDLQKRAGYEVMMLDLRIPGLSVLGDLFRTQRAIGGPPKLLIGVTLRDGPVSECPAELTVDETISLPVSRETLAALLERGAS